MSLSEHISIDTVYTRSINIERDVDSTAIVKAYIPTTRSLLTLRRLAETMGKGNFPRSWALIGPYGSGKSSFAVFLKHLLYSGDEKKTIAALNALAEQDKELSQIYGAQIEEANGGPYASILLTGAPEPLAPRFLKALQEGAEDFWKGRTGPRPQILAEIVNAVNQGRPTDQEIMVLVDKLRVAIEKAGGAGLLIVFDELGKFLEYEARHYGANDIYLLQSLAEMAVKGRKANLYIFTLMHQGFEQYARSLGEDLRNEWAKIQGRFENIPFLESSEQTLRVISRAFSNDFPETDQHKIQENCTYMAGQITKNKALPGGMDQQTAATLFQECYPLHPVTLLLLPTLCQKMAQNERTLFSYLGSKEQYGFHHSLSGLTSVKDWVMPWQVFDYFILNQPAVLTDPTTHRRWAEVVTAIERLGDADPQDLELLKVIGLLNIIGPQAGFKASKEIVSLCTSSQENFSATMTQLTEAAVVQFRKFSNEYRVWQGSDFDLESAVEDELDQLGHFDLSAALNERNPLTPIVARRHTIETGALRYFSPVFTDIATFQKNKEKGSRQRLILSLVENQDELLLARQKICKHYSNQDVVALCTNGAQLREAVSEVLALLRVEKNCPELNSDPVARREFKDRLALAEQIEGEMLTGLLEYPEDIEWYWDGQPFSVTGKRQFQQKLSKVMDNLFCDTPHIFNELINRDKPSAQANAARNKLVAAMVHNLELPDLGIEKFPPEKAIYLAFLKTTGLHSQGEDGQWCLTPPSKENKYNFSPVWQEIDTFLDSTQTQPRSFTELTDKLQSPPFGIKSGVLPLLYLTVFLANQHELAFYENNIYTPYITDQHIDRFMKRPDYFTVQRLRLHGLQASLFQQYVGVLYGNKSPQKASLHAIAKPLAQFMANLDEFTRQTSRISTKSQKARKAVELAKSPSDLLFVKLPKACGFPAIDHEDNEEKKIEGFAAALVNVVKELRDCHQSMLAEIQALITQALLPDVKHELDLPGLRENLRATYGGLGEYTVDRQGLSPFIDHLAEKSARDELWFSRLLMFLGGRASDKWLDIDRDNAVKRLQDLSRRLVDLQYLQSSYRRKQVNTGDDFDVIWLRTMRHGTKSDCDQVVRVDKITKELVSGRKEEFVEHLRRLGDSQTQLAMIAELVDDLLGNNKKEADHETKEGREVNGQK